MSMQVTIFGPNLSSAGQAKAGMHVHATGCADCQHYGPGRKFGGDTGWPLTVNDRVEVSEAVFCDILDENGDAAIDYLGEFYFAPCVSALPEVAS